MQSKQCRICGDNITRIFSLGKMPIVNYFLSQEDLRKPEKKYPLNFCICENCSLAQLDETILPKQLFTHYHYLSSTSFPLKKHLENLAELCKKRFILKLGSRALDIGCNDGVFLSVLQKKGVYVLGVDPAKNIREITKKLGIDLISEIFTFELSEKIKKIYGAFDLIVATNTMAQVPYIHNFIKGIENILLNSGVYVVEVGYLVDMLKKNMFDTIYHEHYSYFSLNSLVRLFSSSSLEIFDAQTISNHGGSIRIFVKHKSNKKIKISRRFLQLLEEEASFRLNTVTSYNSFTTYIEGYKTKFRSLLLAIKKNNKAIVGVGVPAKSVVLLNYCKIDTSLIDYIVDSTPLKQYRFMPGVHIPIFPEDHIAKDTLPDYLLLLAWTYKEELLKKLAIYRYRGAKIIVPFPQIEII